MSTPDLSELGNLHANTAEEENQLIIPDGTMFPPSDHHNDEVQVAGLADIARQGAVFAGRCQPPICYGPNESASSRRCG